VLAAREHGGDAVQEFDLADRRQLTRTVGARHVAALDHYRGADVVAARRKVGEIIVKQIAPVEAGAHVMVRIDDRQAWFDCLFEAMLDRLLDHRPGRSFGRHLTGGQIRSASTGERGACVSAGMNFLVQAMPSGWRFSTSACTRSRESRDRNSYMMTCFTQPEVAISLRAPMNSLIGTSAGSRKSAYQASSWSSDSAGQLKLPHWI